MHTIKMIAPITGRVFPCNSDAVKYLEKAGWKRLQQVNVRKTYPVKTGRVSNGERCTERAKLFHDAVKAEMDWSRLNEKDATNRVLMS